MELLVLLHRFHKHAKLITTGQGGFVVTNNKSLANRVNEIKKF